MSSESSAFVLDEKCLIWPTGWLVVSHFHFYTVMLNRPIVRYLILVHRLIPIYYQKVCSLQSLVFGLDIVALTQVLPKFFWAEWLTLFAYNYTHTQSEREREKERELGDSPNPNDNYTPPANQHQVHIALKIIVLPRISRGSSRTRSGTHTVLCITVNCVPS